MAIARAHEGKVRRNSKLRSLVVPPRYLKPRRTPRIRIANSRPRIVPSDAEEWSKDHIVRMLS